MGTPARLPTFLVSLAFAMASVLPAQEEPGAVKEGTLRAVVLVGWPNTATPEFGTGFLISGKRILFAGSGVRRTFLITNKHLVGYWTPAGDEVRNLRREIAACFYRQRQATDSPCSWRTLRLLTSDDRPSPDLYLHPKATVDLVAIDVTQQIDADLSPNIFDRSMLLLSEHAEKSYVGVGDHVFALGYPSAVKSQRNYPVAKSGYIGSLPGQELTLTTTYQDQNGKQIGEVTITGKLILVDGLVQPGNSGGPVVLESGMRMRLGAKGVEYSEKPQQNKIIGVVSMLHSAGLAIVYSSDYVADLLEMIYARESKKPTQ